MCKEIEELKKILPNLSEVPGLIKFKTPLMSGVSSYEVPKGQMITFQIRSVPNYSLNETWFADGTVVEWHSHEGYEIIIVTEGCLKLFFENKEETLNKRDKTIISSNIPHSAQAIGETWIVAISVPKDEGF